MSYYYVIVQYEDGHEVPCGRVRTNLEDANAFATKVWSILDPFSRRRLRLFVAGDLGDRIGFDSDRLRYIV